MAIEKRNTVLSIYRGLSMLLGWDAISTLARVVIGCAFIHEFKDWDNKAHSRAISSSAFRFPLFCLFKNAVCSRLGRVECR